MIHETPLVSHSDKSSVAARAHALVRRSLRRRLRRRLQCGLPFIAALLGGCETAERVQNALKADQGDPVWQGDSTLLAPHPEILFRVTRDSAGARIVPLATIGDQGFRVLTLSDRGWRAFDIDYLHSGHPLTPSQRGRAGAPLQTIRGMWEGTPLDSIRGCSIILPAAIAKVPNGVEFLTSVPRPPLTRVTSLSAGELQTAINAVPTLIAPAAGIPMSMLPRYTREVFVAESGNGPRPTVVLVFDDPEIVADSVRDMGQRPRHLVVILDKGVYGYKPTYTYSTLGSRRSPPRFRFLDHLDVDGDEKSELLFGLRVTEAPLYTIVLRYDTDAWRELTRYQRQRCHA